MRSRGISHGVGVILFQNGPLSRKQKEILHFVQDDKEHCTHRSQGMERRPEMKRYLVVAQHVNE